MPKKVKRRKRRQRKQPRGWLNRYDFAYAGRDTVNNGVKHLVSLCEEVFIIIM